MKICPYCESELSDTARKCKYCGERVNRKGEKDELNTGNKNYKPNDIIYEYLKHWFDWMNQIEYITDEQAKILSNFDILSKYKCYELQLNGIKELTDNQMSILSQFQWSSISLNWLTSITDNQLEILSNYKTEKYHPFFTICLNWLKTLTDRQAKILTKFQWHKLCLNWLSSVTDKQIEYFNQFIEKDPYNCNVELQWLKSITDRQSEFFSKIRQVVELNNVEYITDKQSEILSTFRWVALSLKWLKKITDTQISNFSKFNWQFLYYSINGNSVKFVNEYDYLETVLNLTNYISDEQFKLFIEKYDGIEVIAKKITDKQAEILSNSGFFKLHDLEELSDKQLKIFSNFKWDYIEIWVEKISERQKDVLLKSLWDRIDIQWNEIYNDDTTEIELTSDNNQNIETLPEWNNIWWKTHPKLKKQLKDMDWVIWNDTKRADLESESRNEKNEVCYNDWWTKKTYLRLLILGFCIVVWFIIPNDSSDTRFFIISWIITLYIIYDEYTKHKSSIVSLFVIWILWISVWTMILCFFTYFVSSLTLLWIYKAWIISPEAYSRIYCSKVAWSLSKHPCSIKWNVSFTTWEKIYHKPGCENYNETVINEAYWELYFPNEETAQKAGFRECKDARIYDWAPGMYDDY